MPDHSEPTSQPEDTTAPTDDGAEVDAVFQPELSTRVSADSLERVLDSLLTRYPDAAVMVMRADGILVEPPPSLELRENPLITARSGIDLILPEDRLRLLETWDRTLSGGAARCVVRLIDPPGLAVAVHQLDMRERHDVVVALVVPTGESADPNPALTREVAKATPRFATVRKDERSFFSEVDEAITEILGWSAEDLEGHRSIEFIHPDDHALAIDNWMEMLATPGPGRRVRLRHKRRDGSWVWFEVTNHNLLDDPQHRCVISEIVDISEEMSAQEELRAREQLLDRLAEAIPLGLFQIDVERNIVYTNDRLHEILGVEPQPSVDSQLASILEADRPVLEQALEEVLGEGSHADIEVQLRLPERGEQRLCSINLRALSFEDGTISGAIACVSDITDSAQMREELKKRATFDELTGCYNRSSIMLALEADLGVERAEGAGERAVMFVDLDRFKAVNDRYGHGAGDEMLRVIAERLRHSVRGDDLVGRIGGDEFLVLCPNIDGPEQAMKLAGRLTEILSKDVPLADATVSHQVSVGVACCGEEKPLADELVARADAAMYESKRERAGRPQLAGGGSKVTARRIARPRTARAVR